MIQVNGNCFVNIEFEGFEGLTLKMFTKLIIKESAEGIIPPIFELHLFQNTYQLYPHVTKTNKEIQITYGTTRENAKKYKFRLYNYNYADQEGGGYNLILTGMLDLKEFTNIPRIKAVNNTSEAVFFGLESVTPIVNYEGKDKQSWIQHGISDKAFVEQVISHAYVSDEDYVMGALTVDKELKVSTAKGIFNTFNKDTTVKIKQDRVNTNPDSIRFDNIKVESDSALWSNFLSEGRVLPVIGVKDRVVKKFTPRLKSLFEDTSYQEFDKNIEFPVQLDNGNCHDNYYQAWVNHLNYGIQLMRNNIYVFTSETYITNSRLGLLDLVQLILGDKSQNELVDPLSGKYIVTEKLTQITQSGYSHRLKLNRDYNM